MASTVKGKAMTVLGGHGSTWMPFCGKYSKGEGHDSTRMPLCAKYSKRGGHDSTRMPFCAKQPVMNPVVRGRAYHIV